jgi:uncharacterized phiE125 gp8 family phage protein
VRYAWQLLTPPTSWPLTLEEAKRQCRLDVDDEDGDTERRIRSATRQAEEFLGRGLLPQTWKYTQDVFTDEILLPRAAPLQTTPVAPIVKYYDTAGALQTLATTVYQVDALSEPGRIYLAGNQAWPAVQYRPMAVEVTYVVGWATVDEVPPDLIDAIALLLGDRERYRENTITGATAQELPNAAKTLLSAHRVYWHEPLECYAS